MVTTTIIQNNAVTSDASSSNNNNNEPTSSTRRVNENRRSNKPIMEKRRRARINNCLNELKILILDAMKKDPARHSKLEKADILEMTVKHLQNLQRQQAAMSAATDPAVVNKFRAGFSECAEEVGRFPGLDPVVKRRLLLHLANCINQGKPETQSQQQAQQHQQQQQQSHHNHQQSQQQVQVHILPQSSDIQTNVTAQPSGIIFSSSTGVQLVPTRLPNGDIALVLPTSSNTPTPVSPPSSSSSSPLPLLVPIPTRTSSSASASSIGSCSPEPMDTHTHTHNYGPISQKPLALVVKKVNEPINEDKPWRPW